MTREAAIEQMQEACKQIALQMVKIHPAIPHLGDETIQADCIVAAHKLTVELETIKKKLIRLHQE